MKLSDCVEQKNHAKIGIAWEKKFAEFVSYNGMPVKGTKLYTWQLEQLSTGAASFNAKIRKELAENKGSTIWSERRVKLCDCVAQKICAKIDNKWESEYTEFKSYDGMPAVGNKLHNWQNNELSNGPGGLNAKIQEERAENKGSTIWTE